MFYGWYIVGGVFTTQFFVVGFMTYCFGLFVLPLQEEFDASRSDVNLAMTAVTLGGLVLSPICGWLVDRYSTRWLMSAGAVIFAGGLYAMASSQQIIHFIVLFGVSVSLGNLLLGPLTGSTTISRWFSANRGKALGIAAVGTSVGGIVLPELMGEWINSQGWREALRTLAIIVLVALLPYLLIVIRATPEEKGLAPDGIAIDPSAPGAAPLPELNIKMIFKHRGFWCIAICLGLLFSAYSSLMANMVAYAIGVGIDSDAAARLIMVIAGAGLVGKILFGMAADKINLKLGLWIAIGLVVIGLLILITEPDYPMMVVAALSIGLAAGGMLPVWGAMLAVIFGVASYGRVMGLMNPVITLFVMPGYFLTGYIFDQTGTYNTAFILFCGMLFAAALVLAALKLPGKEPQAETN